MSKLAYILSSGDHSTFCGIQKLASGLWIDRGVILGHSAHSVAVDAGFFFFGMPICLMAGLFGPVCTVLFLSLLFFYYSK